MLASDGLLGYGTVDEVGLSLLHLTHQLVDFLCQLGVSGIALLEFLAVLLHHATYHLLLCGHLGKFLTNRLTLPYVMAPVRFVALLFELLSEGLHLLVEFLLHLAHGLGRRLALAGIAALRVALAWVLALAVLLFLVVLAHLVLHLVEAFGQHESKIVERRHAILHGGGGVSVAVVAVETLVHIKQTVEGAADAIIDGGYYSDYACSFFSENIGKPLDPKLENQNWCGAGKMLAVDAAGNFYPCTRFAGYSLREKRPIIIGNVRDGIDKNKLRPFLTLDRLTQSPRECIDCEVASGCAWCQGENYDAAATDTIYQRATAICLMHKARVRANNYYWNKLYRKLELEGEREEFESNKPKINETTC